MDLRSLTLSILQIFDCLLNEYKGWFCRVCFLLGPVWRLFLFFLRCIRFHAIFHGKKLNEAVLRFRSYRYFDCLSNEYKVCRICLLLGPGVDTFSIFFVVKVFPHFFRTNCGLTGCYVVEPVDFLIAFGKSLRFPGFLFYSVRCGHIFNIFCSE